MDIRVAYYAPESLLQDKAVRDSISNVMNKKSAPEVIKLFKRTTYGWSNKPLWGKKLERKSSYIAISIFSKGVHSNQYAIVNAGSPRHDILPRKSTFLQFRIGYTAATKPRILGSKKKQRFGKQVQAEAVDHPGFEAREFDKTVADKYEPMFIDDMNEAIAIAAGNQASKNLQEFHAFLSSLQ